MTNAKGICRTKSKLISRGFVAFSIAFLSLVAVADYQIVPVKSADVRISGGFWLDRLETNRVVTLRTNLAKCNATPRIANFTNAAARAWGKHGGAVWDDSDVYKVTSSSIRIRLPRRMVTSARSGLAVAAARLMLSVSCLKCRLLPMRPMAGELSIGTCLWRARQRLVLWNLTAGRTTRGTGAFVPPADLQRPFPAEGNELRTEARQIEGARARQNCLALARRLASPAPSGLAALRLGFPRFARRISPRAALRL